MNWFDKWLSNKMRKAWDDSSGISINQAIQKREYNLVGAKTADIISRDRMDSNPDLHFRMFRAENGYVMEVRYHDKRTDRTSCNLHLISDEQDLGQSIAHIITVESLKVN